MHAASGQAQKNRVFFTALRPLHSAATCTSLKNCWVVVVVVVVAIMLLRAAKQKLWDRKRAWLRNQAFPQCFP
jgi:hypothetical protein